MTAPRLVLALVGTTEYGQGGRVHERLPVAGRSAHMVVLQELALLAGVPTRGSPQSSVGLQSFGIAVDFTVRSRAPTRAIRDEPPVIIVEAHDDLPRPATDGAGVDIVLSGGHDGTVPARGAEGRRYITVVVVT